MACRLAGAKPLSEPETNIVVSVWTNAGILLIGPPRTNFSETEIEIYTFLFKKMHLKMSSAKWRPFCLGLNVLTGSGPYLIGTRMMQEAAGVKNGHPHPMVQMSYDISFFISSNLSGVETGIHVFQENQINAMAADALAIDHLRLSEPQLWYWHAWLKWALVFHGEEFKLSLPF